MVCLSSIWLRSRANEFHHLSIERTGLHGRVQAAWSGTEEMGASYLVGIV